MLFWVKHKPYIFEKTPELEAALTQYFVKDCYSARQREAQHEDE